jgi:hemolysin III
MGWLILPLYSTVVEALTFNGAVLILAGGVCYTIGAILYGIGKKKKYAHNVFHVFVLVGSMLHFFGILFYGL